MATHLLVLIVTRNLFSSSTQSLAGLTTLKYMEVMTVKPESLGMLDE